MRRAGMSGAPSSPVKLTTHGHTAAQKAHVSTSMLPLENGYLARPIHQGTPLGSPMPGGKYGKKRGAHVRLARERAQQTTIVTTSSQHFRASVEANSCEQEAAHCMIISTLHRKVSELQATLRAPVAAHSLRWSKVGFLFHWPTSVSKGHPITSFLALMGLGSRCGRRLSERRLRPQFACCHSLVTRFPRPRAQ